MMLFQDMSAQAPFTNMEVDLALKLLREEFLCLVLSNAIHEIPEEMTEDDDDAEQFSSVSQLSLPNSLLFCRLSPF